MRQKIIDECSEHVPSTIDFSIGYFDGSQQAKVLLVTTDDIQTMYKKRSAGGSLTLWCDGRTVTAGKTSGRKRKHDNAESSYREEKESDVDTIFQDLQETHEGDYDAPRLRLWSRMIATGIHNDYHNPPNIPAFTGTSAKRTRKDNLSQALSTAAVAVVDAIKDNKSAACETTPSSSSTSLSPDIMADVRMKNYQQLRYLHTLFDDGIISESEFSEQKETILSSVRKL